MSSSKKEPTDSRTIRRSTREVSIDTLQATAIDSVDQKSIDNNTTSSIDITCEKAERVEHDLNIDRRQDLNVDRRQDLNVDRRHDLNVDRRHDLNVDRRHDLNVDRRHDLNVDRQYDLNVDRQYDLNVHHQYNLSHRSTLHPHSIIDRHTPEIVDRHPSLEELPGYIVELEPVEERVHESEASRNADSKHLRPLIWAEEAVGFHKRVKRIHDPVKFVVPCAVFEAESPIPPDRSMQFSSYNEVLDDHQHVEVSQKGLRFRDEVDKGPTEASSVDTDRILSNDTTYAISNDINKPASIDATTSPSIDTGRSGGKKRRHWKKRKRTKGGSQLSLIPNFSDGVKKYRVRSRCFSQPFAKLRALLIVEMIDKGVESMEDAFTQE
ncbi:hypothetical protein DY000_02031163 [Brassica cretica]|uniref:Uncharacterized protein n=1 Tax=Brassica cretica TaxID=69181 RepID=A0ABQ7DUU3_BRACR|nr:hypothetical protein DY000_02031163 [Brassica cretica]